jgi:hypothetical protein
VLLAAREATPAQQAAAPLARVKRAERAQKLAMAGLIRGHLAAAPVVRAALP